MDFIYIGVGLFSLLLVFMVMLAVVVVAVFIVGTLIIYVLEHYFKFALSGFGILIVFGLTTFLLYNLLPLGWFVTWFIAQTTAIIYGVFFAEEQDEIGINNTSE